MDEETRAALDECTHHIIALRTFVQGFAASLMASLKVDKAAFDGFAGHIRDNLDVLNDYAPGAEAAHEALPKVLSHLDAILAEVRRQIPK